MYGKLLSNVLFLPFFSFLLFFHTLLFVLESRLPCTWELKAGVAEGAVFGVKAVFCNPFHCSTPPGCKGLSLCLHHRVLGY